MASASAASASACVANRGMPPSAGRGALRKITGPSRCVMCSTCDTGSASRSADRQHLDSEACGYFCLAFLYYMQNKQNEEFTVRLNTFANMFQLNQLKRNEQVLKAFFNQNQLNYKMSLKEFSSYNKPYIFYQHFYNTYKHK
jgi:hypothetical protein